MMYLANISFAASSKSELFYISILDALYDAYPDELLEDVSDS